MNTTKTLFAVAALQTTAESVLVKPFTANHPKPLANHQLAQTEGIFGSIGNWFENAADTVADGVTDAANAVTDGVADIYEDFADTNVGDAITDAYQDLADEVSSLILAQTQSQGIFSNIGNWIENTANNVVDEVSDVADSVADVIDELTNAANVIASCGDSLEDALICYSAVEDAATDIYQQAEDLANNAASYTEAEYQDAIISLEQAYLNLI